MGEFAAVPARPAEALPAGPRSRLLGGGGAPLRWDGLRYLIFGRVLPSALYTVLGVLVVRGVVDRVEHPSGGWLGVLAGPVRSALYAAFCLIPVVLFVVRPRPRAEDRRLLPRAVAFVATTMLLALAVLPSGPRLVALPAGAGAAGSLVLLLATAGEVWALLTLGLSFGIFPAARRLVTRGPYRRVRHPLYLFEILCALTVLVPHVSLWPLLMVIAFCALQVRRLGYEEAILDRTMPEWAGWARRTARLVPGVW